MKYVALLRAVNVGGTGRLPMPDLRKMCRDAGFSGVETYIASGNVVFSAAQPAAEVQAALEHRLAARAGRPVGVVLRTAAEMAAVLRANPFPDTDPKITVAIFLNAPVPPDALSRVRGRTCEEIRPAGREIYVWYPQGQGRSKLRIPAADGGTARNMNTVRKLATMAGGA